MRKEAAQKECDKSLCSRGIFFFSWMERYYSLRQESWQVKVGFVASGGRCVHLAPVRLRYLGYSNGDVWGTVECVNFEGQERYLAGE